MPACARVRAHTHASTLMCDERLERGQQRSHFSVCYLFVQCVTITASAYAVKPPCALLKSPNLQAYKLPLASPFHQGLRPANVPTLWDH